MGSVSRPRHATTGQSTHPSKNRSSARGGGGTCAASERWQPSPLRPLPRRSRSPATRSQPAPILPSAAGQRYPGASQPGSQPSATVQLARSRRVDRRFRRPTALVPGVHKLQSQTPRPWPPCRCAAPRGRWPPGLGLFLCSSPPWCSGQRQISKSSGRSVASQDRRPRRRSSAGTALSPFVERAASLMKQQSNICGIIFKLFGWMNGGLE